ncbi:NYN domain-containing protein [Thalassoroseus pseudoceratinae]|uniref:NYN domain-containing protein n=1 Tax=Thalassoroseus pseudoceratinae TaxID=2713176 RepID=UPI00141FB49A|nr:NYN domain-containing protein [Thalassoroseus pseudoceratinae]
MTHNTAIFFDIENLIGGYGKALYLDELSLTDIHSAIVDNDVSGIAIQRAYANWSDSRLNTLRADIVELGIEPIQMFGFGKGSHKNASDIHLAIDAMEVLLTKPAIDRFVIVSGDGGFSSLAKRIHEYSKTVIGCAYRRAANQVFEAVCDDFIWLEEPESASEHSRNSASGSGNHNPIVAAYGRKYRRIEPQDSNSVINRGKEILGFLSKSHSSRDALARTGLNISVYKELLSYRMFGFDPIKCGFPKFVDFVRHTVHGSALKLVLKEPSEYRLINREHVIRGFVTVDGVPGASGPHSLDSYFTLLSRIEPRFPVPDLDVLHELASHLVEYRNDVQGIRYAELVEGLAAEFDYGEREIRGVVTCMISAKCFARLPQGVPLSEQRLFLDCSTQSDVIQKIYQGMYQKIEASLGRVDTECLERVLPIWQSVDEPKTYDGDTTSRLR